jgi:hypothetical protein
MRFLAKKSSQPDLERADATPTRDVRADLERRGIAAAFSGPMAARLMARVDGLSEAQYGALLDGAVAAYGVNREEERSGVPGPVEMERLIQDFAVELQKLDEGLRLLSTYLTRIRDRTAGDASRVMH